MHEVRQKLNISCNEYCVADLIDNYAYNANNPLQWCYATKETIASVLGLSKQTVLTIIEKLIELGLVEKHEQTKNLRTTKAWFNCLQTGKETLPETALPAVKKLYQDGKETLPKPGKETLPYIESTNKEINIENIKDAFFKKIIDWRDLNPNTYPKGLYDNFFKYWTEEKNTIGKKKSNFQMRFQDEKYFDVGRRLGTFWKFTKDEEKLKLWNLHKMSA
jgi:hypothetical protein